MSIVCYLNMIINYGIPYALLTDKRTVFEYKLKSNKSLENDTFTQYAYACHILGIDLRTTSSTQAKGRVERIFGTLQSFLVNELRINNINDIESANMFLPQFIEAFNNKFSININNTLNVFQMQDDIEELNLILSVINTRKVDKGNCIRFNNKYYAFLDNNGLKVYPRPSSNVLVIKSFDNKLFASVNDNIYSLEEVERISKVSNNFDDVVEVKVKKNIFLLYLILEKENHLLSILKRARNLKHILITFNLKVPKLSNFTFKF